MAGRKPSGTWVFARKTQTKPIDPDNFARETAAARRHNSEEMWRLAVAFRLQEYADARVLTRMIENHHQTPWLKKVRRTQKHNVKFLPATICRHFDEALIKFGLPPL